MAIGDALARLRQDRGLTQEELAAKIHVTRQAVSRWETGETEPSIDMVKLLALVLEVPVDTLLSNMRYANDPFEQEARERYGDQAVDATQARLAGMSADEWSAANLLEESIKVQLRLAMSSGSEHSEESKELARMHQRWIRIHWGEGYSAQAHLGLARGYLADQRFCDYYGSACGEGATRFLVEVLQANLQQEAQG